MTRVSESSDRVPCVVYVCVVVVVVVVVVVIIIVCNAPFLYLFFNCRPLSFHY